MENIDTNRKLRGIRKKPEWAEVGVINMTTPLALGLLTDAFTLAPAFPGRLTLSLDIDEYVIADNAGIYVQQRVVGLNWRNVGLIIINAGMITTLVGPSASMFSPVGGVAASIVGEIQFDIYVDSLLGLRLQVEQFAGGGPRTLSSYYNYIMEI